MGLLLTQVWTGYKDNFKHFLDEEELRVNDLPQEEYWQRSNYRALSLHFNQANYDLIDRINEISSQTEMAELKESAGQVSQAQLEVRLNILKSRVDEAIFTYMVDLHSSCKQHLGIEKAEELLKSCMGPTASYVMKEEFPDYL